MKIAKFPYHSKSRFWISVFAILVLLLTPFVAIISQAPTAHATLAGFSAGNIMDDIVMSKRDALTQAQIQSFLKSKNSCNDRGLSRLTGYNSTKGWLKADGTTYYYNLKDGHFICMADQDFNGESAAHIIWQAAQDYNLNPQVLIVLLEKEQGLVTDTWPNYNVQYRSATGFGCPDTAPCDTQYYGLKNQIRQAASLFREVLTGGWTNYPVGWNYIQYNPSASCGGSNIYVKNRATSSLYRYTPYQPNQAALNAGWGAAYPCGAYGNRNFYNLFTTWFGSTHAVFVNLLSPRWMQAKGDIYKRNPVTNETIDSVIPSGSQIYFGKKITVNGRMYLQTQNDTNNGLSKGILYSDLEEVPMNYTPLLQPRWMETTRDVFKINPQTNQKVGAVVPAGTKIYFPTKITVGGTSYLRTRHDTDSNLQTGIPLSTLQDATIEYTSLTQPRWLEAATNTSSIDLSTGRNVGDSIPGGKQIFFKYKMIINTETYVSESLPPDNTTIGVPFSSLTEIKPAYSSLKYPRWFVVRSDTHKYNPITEQQIDDVMIPAGTKIYFPTAFSVGGKTYLRTQYGTSHGLNEGILMSDLQENYVDMVVPRALKTKVSTYKRNPTTGEVIGATIPPGTSLNFSSKVIVGNITYLRTQTDSDANIDAVIPIGVLQ